MNYYISDMHLFHANVTAEGANFDGRPFQTLDEMHAEMLKRWNEKVNNGDKVFILGDICWKENEDAIALVAKLRGDKIMVKGNHDRCKDARYRQLFTEICDYKELTDNMDGINHNLVLSHFPILAWNKMNKGSILLYGHVHSDSFDEWNFNEALKRANEYYSQRDGERYQLIRAYNVGAMKDYMNYTPRTLKEIMYANRVEI